MVEAACNILKCVVGGPRKYLLHHGWLVKNQIYNNLSATTELFIKIIFLFTL